MTKKLILCLYILTTTITIGFLMWKSESDKEDYATQLDSIRIERDSIALELEGSMERTKQLKIAHDATISILEGNLADISSIGIANNKTINNVKINLVSSSDGIWSRFGTIP